MKKAKGIVMRSSSKLTVIFTEKGDFLEIPTPKEPPVVGQTIEVTIEPRRLSAFHNSLFKYATAAVLLIVLSISAFSLLFIPNMAVASVALDINKGVELLINKEGEVIKVQDVNGGLSIVEGLSLKGLDVYQAFDLILENAYQKGTLDETHNLILVNVVPVNNWGTNLIDTEKLRSLIRDEMTRRNMFGSVVVSQTNQKIQQEAKQQEMTVNSYLIYNRSEAEGIVVQPDALRNDVQIALLNANVSIFSLFPEESFEVRAQDRKGNSTDTQKEPAVQHAPENRPPANTEANTTESQNWPSGSNSSNWSAPKAPSEPPVDQSQQGTSPDLSIPSSGQASPDISGPKGSSPQQPTKPHIRGR